MRIILDTNVLIDADKGSHSYPAKIMQEVIDGHIEGFASKKILAENRMIKRQTLRDPEILELFDEYMKAMTIVRPKQHFQAFPTDHEDDKYIDAAVEAGAKYIVTSDHDLIDVREYEGVMCVTPQEFWNKYQGEVDPEGKGAWQNWMGGILGQ